MTVYLNIMASDRKSRTIDDVAFPIETAVETSSELLACIIRHCCRGGLPDGLEREPIVEVLSGAREAASKADGCANAIRNALQYFEDGLLEISINGERVDIDRNIHLSDRDKVSIIRSAKAA